MYTSIYIYIYTYIYISIVYIHSIYMYIYSLYPHDGWAILVGIARSKSQPRVPDRFEPVPG